jgi:hypothetical protein
MHTLTMPPTRRLLFVALVAAGAGGTPAAAQERVVAPGDRVRLTLSCAAAGAATAAPGTSCVREGTLARLNESTVDLFVHGSTETHALTELLGVEVRDLDGPDGKVSAGAGAILGGAGTYLWLDSGGSTSKCDRSSNQDAMSAGECAGLVALGGLIGAGVGALVSRLLRTERWVPARVGRVDLFPGRP